ncbi:MAG: hypothetical protein ACRD0L_15745 [Acidimicrobiales bacterium]
MSLRDGMGPWEEQVARLAVASGCRVLGVDPAWAQVAEAARRGGGGSIGPYLVEDETVEEVEKGVFIPFVHRPLSRYVNALAANGLLVVRMEEPAPPPAFLAQAFEYGQAATIPRLLVLVAEKQ